MKKASDIENVRSVNDLGALARRKRLKSEFKSIAKSTLEDALKEGWEIQRENKTNYRVTSGTFLVSEGLETIWCEQSR